MLAQWYTEMTGLHALDGALAALAVEERQKFSIAVSLLGLRPIEAASTYRDIR